MAKFSKTWWGQRFIAALEEFSDTRRLSRGWVKKPVGCPNS